MGFSNLSISFWRYALESACYVLNKISNKFVSKTPYEIWIGCKPGLSHLRIWSCPAYVKYLKTDKLGARSDRCNFIGYLKEIKGYYFYIADEQKVFVNLRTVFLEKKFLGEGINASKVDLEEVQQVEPTQSSEPIELKLMMSNPKPVVGHR